MADKQTRWATVGGRVALAAVLIAFATYVIMHLEWREETTRSGLNGEARHNNYYAGMLLLTKSSYETKRIDDAVTLDDLSAHSTLLLDSSTLFNNRKQAKKLTDWIRRGGHLALPLNRRTDPDVLLHALGINTLGWNETSKKAQVISVEGDSIYANLHDAVVFDLDAETDWEVELRGYFDKQTDAVADQEADEESEAAGQPQPKLAFHTEKVDKVPAAGLEEHSVYARWKLGQGYVTAGYFEPFQNINIEENDHASLFVRLMTLPKDKRPVFIALPTKYPSLGAWLVKNAAEALIALATLLAVFLWRAMQRFGPPVPDDLPARPGLLEHLSAVGDFLLRQKQYEALIAPLREDIKLRLTQLRSRHPEIGTLPELGAHIAQLDIDEIILALTPGPANAHEFQRRSQTLAILRRHCGEMQNAFIEKGY